MKLQEQTWKKSDFQTFWGEIAPADHLVQVYEDDNVLLNTLEGFAGSGFIAGDCVVIIAKAVNLEALSIRLKDQHFDLDSLILSGQYIPVNADDLLNLFMVNDWPHDKKFRAAAKALITRANWTGRPVRAYGEMVAILWENGLKGATVHLENLWNTFREKNRFTLFCAYPSHIFEHDNDDAVFGLCSCHNKLISGWKRPSTEISFLNIQQEIIS
jgi:hypothetical protein